MHDRDRPAFASLFAKALHLQQRGRITEAVLAYERALREDGHAVAALYNYGCMLIAAGRHRDAFGALSRANALTPNDPETLHALGFSCAELGRHDEAIAYLRQSLTCAANTTVHVRLAQALLAAGRYEPAQDAFAEILAATPDRAECHEGIGIIFHHAGRLDDAITAFRRAVACDDTYANAACNLAKALLEAGDTDEARLWIERAIERNPHDGRFYLLLVTCTSGPLAPATIAAMARLAEAGAALPLEQRMELHFSLGRAYEREGRTLEAFRHLAQGNALKREQVPYNEFAAVGYLRRLRRTFTPQFMDALRGAAEPSERPIFIFGMPRSGTTLVEQILASHPGIHGGGEMKHLDVILMERFRAMIGQVEWISRLKALGPADLHALGQAYLAKTAALAPEGLRVTDKMPLHFRHVGLIHLIFPDALIIHCRRTPQDTCLSCFATHFSQGQDFTYDLADLGAYYRAYNALMDHWHRVVPSNRLVSVTYEDVVGDIEGEARRLIAACGLAWDEACVDFHRTSRQVRTASVNQVRQPLYATSVARWKAYSAHLKPLGLEERS